MKDKSLLEKLMEIQEKIAVPKSLHNDFAGFNYRSAEQILEEAKPIARELGCLITISDEIITVGSWNYVQATATLHDTVSKELYSVTSSAREQEAKKGMDTSQITGATSSYARKYALSGLLALDDTKDADSMDNSKPPTRTERIDSMSPLNQKKGRIVKEMYSMGITNWKDQKSFIVDVIAKDVITTEDEADLILEHINKAKEEVES